MVADEIIIVALLLFGVIPAIIHWSISLSNLRRIDQLEAKIQQLQHQLNDGASPD